MKTRNDQTTSRDWADMQVIRLQRGIEKTRKWSDNSEGMKTHADDQNTAREWQDTQMIRLQQELSYCTTDFLNEVHRPMEKRTVPSFPNLS
jgi:hypothetical protein